MVHDSTQQATETSEKKEKGKVSEWKSNSRWHVLLGGAGYIPKAQVCVCVCVSCLNCTECNDAKDKNRAH